MEYSIVIPAYNEALGITATLSSMLNFMRSFSKEFEIFVVDDGSSDSTADVVATYSIQNPEVKLIENPHKGKGYAVRSGMLASQGDLVLMADSDGAMPIEELKRLLTWIKDHDFDIVIASREGVGAQRKNEPFVRHLMGRIFNLIIQILVLPGIKDTQCGYKLFKGTVASDIFSRLVLFGPNTPDTDKPRVTAFDVEVLFLAKKLGYKVKEVPITWNFIKTVRVSPIRDSLVNLGDVLKVKLNDLKGLYKV